MSKKGIYYRAEDKYLDIQDLKEVLSGLSRVRWRKTNNAFSDNTYYHFHTSSIDSGCKKKVPIEDWTKVMDAYTDIINDQA